MSNKFVPPVLVTAFLEAIPEGQMFTVTFEKQDGTTRKMNCRRGVTSHLQGGESTIADKEHLVGVYEMAKVGYRCFDNRRVFSMHGGGLIVAVKDGDK
jgi:hypothetical protein